MFQVFPQFVQAEIDAMTRFLNIMILLISVAGLASLVMILGSLVHICLTEYLRPSTLPARKIQQLAEGPFYKPQASSR